MLWFSSFYLIFQKKILYTIYVIRLKLSDLQIGVNKFLFSPNGIRTLTFVTVW